jgi:ubiquinone/menaquinone biosynthesis C-methylase UbiE
LVEPVGVLVLDRIGVEPGMDLLDVGTGSGGTVAIPAALRGATVVGCDVTPELFEHARRRAAAAGVEVEWVEADAQDLPFGDASFDRVTSTFGAMFAPDHTRAAAELVRVCRPGGRIAMTTWVNTLRRRAVQADGLVHAACAARRAVAAAVGSRGAC